MLAALSAPVLLWSQTASRTAEEGRIDVDAYVIEAEIHPDAQDFTAKAAVSFTVLDTEIRYAAFELHNGIELEGVVDSDNEERRFTRSAEDFAVRVQFDEPRLKGDFETLTFTYRGRFTGREESPVWGINFASIQPDHGFLLYPARWFPVNDYTTDRYKATLKVTVPDGFRVLSSGIATTERAGSGLITYNFDFTQPAFPGSLAVVRGEGQTVESEGVRTTVYFRGDNAGMANAYGQEMGRVMTFLSGLYGLPPESGLTVVETASGSPNGYSAPGMLFIASPSIGDKVDTRLLLNQTARQWWGTLSSPATRNHLWLTNGAARYSELLWIEATDGPAAMIPVVRDNYIEALTAENVPLIQASRLEDYSPEFWAATAGKGAAVLNMLRQIVGEEKFSQVMKRFLEEFAWKSFSTDDFRRLVEAGTGQSLQGFFIQWIESSGAPEFKIEYTVYRTQKGFRILGKISQDLDTFRMPVKLRIETEGNPEETTVEVVGASSDFAIETFGKPKKLVIDPDGNVLRYSDEVRVAVAVRRGELFAEISEFTDALREYQKALDVNRFSSLAHYRVAEVFFLQRNYQSAANEFREAINGDRLPAWTEVWSYINLGKIFDITGQRDRAVNEYQRALRTKDNTQGALEEAAKYLQSPYQRPQDRI